MYWTWSACSSDLSSIKNTWRKKYNMPLVFLIRWLQVFEMNIFIWKKYNQTPQFLRLISLSCILRCGQDWSVFLLIFGAFTLHMLTHILVTVCSVCKWLAWCKLFDFSAIKSNSLPDRCWRNAADWRHWGEVFTWLKKVDSDSDDWIMFPLLHVKATVLKHLQTTAGLRHTGIL